MSKGPRPPKDPPAPIPSDDPSTPDDVERVCWTFTPIELTSIAGDLLAGDKLGGAVANVRVQINCDKGAVGFVPRKESREIVDLVRHRPHRLLGQVLSNEDSLIVELCAIR